MTQENADEIKVDVKIQTGNSESGDPGDSAEPTEVADGDRVALLEKELALYKDQFLRKAADFENFRRRKEKEFAELIVMAEEKLIKDLLPVSDDIERVLKNADKFLDANPDAKIYVDGVRLVQQKFMKALEAHGLKRLSSVGKDFDVDFHEALTQMEKEGVPPETVIEEFEAGYTLGDKVIRHAKVVVSK